MLPHDSAGRFPAFALGERHANGGRCFEHQRKLDKRHNTRLRDCHLDGGNCVGLALLSSEE
jgi:hypothetical protein